MALTASIGISGLILIFGRDIYSLFTQDQAVIEIGMKRLWLMVPFYFTYLGVTVMSG